MLGHREDIPEIMGSLDVVVHPSYANEGVPQSILQAMAMKRPVVASNAGAIREVIIDGETGFLIEPKDSVQLSEKVVELYDNRNLIIKFGENSRRLVEESYSLDGMLNKIEILYARLLNP
jgi:glycosyltransferase involved in cell wall biosynthesis